MALLRHASQAAHASRGATCARARGLLTETLDRAFAGRETDLGGPMNEKQKIAYDAFMLGIQWGLETARRVIPGSCDEISDREIQLLKNKAGKILTFSNDGFVRGDIR